jgi:hypothetical protein
VDRKVPIFRRRNPAGYAVGVSLSRHQGGLSSTRCTVRTRAYLGLVYIWTVAWRVPHCHIATSQNAANHEDVKIHVWPPWPLGAHACRRHP